MCRYGNYKIFDDLVIKPFKSLKGITLLHNNIRSLVKNFDEFELFLNVLKPDIFCLSETWLNEDISDFEVRIKDYKLFRNDRKGRRGGGVAIYVKNRLFATQTEIGTDIESLTIEVKQPNGAKFYLSVIYRPPDSDNEFFDGLNTILIAINGEHIITGDLNFNLMNKINDKYIKTFKDKGYDQLIQDPTRCTAQSQTLIDHILYNERKNMSGFGVLDLSISDHKMIFFGRKINFEIIKNNKNRVNNVIKYRNYANLDYTRFHTYLDSKYPELYCNQELKVNCFAEKLTEILIQAFDRFSPLIEKTVKYNNKTFITSEIKKVIQNKNKCFQILQKSIRRKDKNLNEIYANFRKIRNECNLMIKKAKQKYFSNIIYENRYDTKKLWKVLSNLIETKNSKKANDDLILDMNQINKYFINSSKELLKSFAFHHQNRVSEQIVDNFELNFITDEEVMKIVDNFKITKASGVDGLSPKMLKMSIPSLLPHLKTLINLIIKNSEFPNKWKTSLVTPILKNGSKNDFKNYRPISVMPSMSKLFEIHLSNQMTIFLNEKSIISKNQL